MQTSELGILRKSGSQVMMTESLTCQEIGTTLEETMSAHRLLA
jgi:hypothetical protein